MEIDNILGTKLNQIKKKPDMVMLEFEPLRTASVMFPF